MKWVKDEFYIKKKDEFLNNASMRRKCFYIYTKTSKN